MKYEIPNITNLGITSALTAVVYLPITQTLVKWKRRSLIISIINALLIENLISLQQKEIFDLSLRRANLASKSDIANFVNKTNFDSKKRYIK